MKKAIICVLLALTLALLGQEQVRRSLLDAADAALGGGQQEQEAEIPSFSEQIGVGERKETLDVALYFRFAQTDVLGTQRMTIDLRREETIAHGIVRSLVQGPYASHEQLSGVFPQATRVISVTGEGDTAFVTLSRDFLGRPDGAPRDWEDLEVWQEEATLRRWLAMQSLVLSLTEGGRYQRVQLYIADSDDDIPERVPLYWFDRRAEDVSVVLAASARDEQAMLTPARAMEMILEAWQAQDWEALYAFIAAQDKPAYSVFEADMRSMGVYLLSYALSAGTVSFDGQSATIVLDAAIRSREGGDAQIIRESVPLVRSADNWSIATKTLEALMIRD